VRWGWIELGHPAVSLAAQCDLLGLSRSTGYERTAEPSVLNLALMRRLDEAYTAHPFYGSWGDTPIVVLLH
jgi:putative transposase